MKSNKKVLKKNMSWRQAKAKHPKLKPFGDADKDGVQNWLDCKPFNRNKQGIFHDLKNKIFRKKPEIIIKKREEQEQKPQPQPPTHDVKSWFNSKYEDPRKDFTKKNNDIDYYDYD